jgi:hypothetical protein
LAGQYIKEVLEELKKVREEEAAKKTPAPTTAPPGGGGGSGWPGGGGGSGGGSSASGNAGAVAAFPAQNAQQAEEEATQQAKEVKEILDDEDLADSGIADSLKRDYNIQYIDGNKLCDEDVRTLQQNLKSEAKRKDPKKVYDPQGKCTGLRDKLSHVCVITSSSCLNWQAKF